MQKFLTVHADKQFHFYYVIKEYHVSLLSTKSTSN